MLIGFLYITFLQAVSTFIMGVKKSLLVPFVLWFTMRFAEDGTNSYRELKSLCNTALLWITKKKSFWAILMKTRKAAKEHIDLLLKMEKDEV